MNKISVAIFMILHSLLAGKSAATAASPRFVVRTRLVLAPDGQVGDLAPYLAEGKDPVRIALGGTLSCGLDGSELDAMSRWVGGVRFEADGPFVVLPQGSRLIESDVVAHRYVVELPRAQSMPIFFNPAPFAAKYLVTPEEIARSLEGAIGVEILEPAPDALTSAANRRIQSASTLPLGRWIGGSLAGAALLFCCAALVRRRWRLQDRVLLRRAHAALRVAQREIRSLGPLFKDVERSCRQLLEAARAVQAQLRATQRAFWRSRRLCSTAAETHKEKLRQQEQDILAHLAIIVERLEEIATELAAHRVGQAPESAVQEALGALKGEIELALAAETEARALVKVA